MIYSTSDWVDFFPVLELRISSIYNLYWNGLYRKSYILWVYRFPWWFIIEIMISNTDLRPESSTQCNQSSYAMTLRFSLMKSMRILRMGVRNCRIRHRPLLICTLFDFIGNCYEKWINICTAKEYTIEDSNEYLFEFAKKYLIGQRIAKG